MNKRNYLMEGDEEAVRLDLKTDPEAVKKQAQWAGLKPGMRVADLGCGAGKTTFYLNELAGSTGAGMVQKWGSPNRRLLPDRAGGHPED